MKRIVSVLSSVAVMLSLSANAFAEGNGSDKGGIDPLTIAVGVIIGIIVAIIVMMYHKGKLKSVRRESAAANYIKNGSMNVTLSREIYLYKRMRKTPKPKDN